MVKILLEHPHIDPNIRTAEWNGCTSALTAAAQCGNIQIVAALLAHPRTNVNIQTKEGWTALTSASGGGVSVIRKLLAHPKIDVNIPTKHEDRTAVHYAAKCNKLDILQTLLADKRVKFNMPDKDGNTPLMLAAQEGNLECVKALVEAEANIDIQRKSGETALHLALQNGRMDVAHYLRLVIQDRQAVQEAKVLAEKQKELAVEQEKCSVLVRRGSSANITRAEQASVQQELNQLRTICAHYMQECTLKQQHLESEHYLTADPLLQSFYFQLQTKLSELFLAYKVLSSALVKREESTTESLMKKGISIGGNVIPLPGISVVVGLAEIGVDFFYSKKAEKRFSFISNLIRNLQVLDREVQDCARLLTFQYEEQILQLKDENAALLLAECAIGRLMNMMHAQAINQSSLGRESSLAEALCVSIVSFQSHQGTLPFTDKKIGVKSGKTWTDKHIFQASGVLVREGNYYAEADVASLCQSKIYGYRLGILQDVQRMKLIPVTQPQRTPHLLVNNPYRWEAQPVLVPIPMLMPSVAAQIGSVESSSALNRSVIFPQAASVQSPSSAAALTFAFQPKNPEIEKMELQNQQLKMQLELKRLELEQQRIQSKRCCVML